MDSVYRRRTRPVRPPEIAFITTIAVVSLFTLYSFVRNHDGYAYHDATEAARALRALEEPDQEVRASRNSMRRTKLTCYTVPTRTQAERYL